MADVVTHLLPVIPRENREPCAELNAGFSTSQVAQMAGLTYRQLDHWARSKVLVPETEADGSGTRRRYNVTQLEQACIAAEVMSLGFDFRAANLAAVQLVVRGHAKLTAAAVISEFGIRDAS